MIGAIVIVIGGLVTAAIAFTVAWRYRRGNVSVDWSAFAAMGFGSLMISAFYLAITEATWHDHNILDLAPYSRVIFGFVLLSTALMALFALKGNGTKNE